MERSGEVILVDTLAATLVETRAFFMLRVQFKGEPTLQSESKSGFNLYEKTFMINNS